MTNFPINIPFRERAKRDDSSAKNGSGASTANEDKDRTTQEMISSKGDAPRRQTAVCFGNLTQCTERIPETRQVTRHLQTKLKENGKLRSQRSMQRINFILLMYIFKIKGKFRWLCGQLRKEKGQILSRRKNAGITLGKGMNQ